MTESRSLDACVANRQKGNFQGDENVLCHDCGGYVTINSSKLLKCVLQRVYFLHINYTSIKLTFKIHIKHWALLSKCLRKARNEEGHGGGEWGGKKEEEKKRKLLLLLNLNIYLTKHLFNSNLITISNCFYCSDFGLLSEFINNPGKDMSNITQIHITSAANQGFFPEVSLEI